MFKVLRKFVLIWAVLCGQTVYAGDEFSLWVDDLRTEAVLSGISEEVVQQAVEHIAFLPEVIAMDRSQPEFVTPFLHYFQQRVNPQKIRLGRELLSRHADLLEKIETQYGVSKYVLVAFWGMETHFGMRQGKVDVLSALATLAYDGRRQAFFRDQLLDAIRMIDFGHVDPAKLTGSWAGAYGNMQFMPTTFMLYAVDGDGDGRIDVASSMADAFASAANYLAHVGWRSQEPIILEVQLPSGFDWHQAQLELKKPLAEWAADGVLALQPVADLHVGDLSEIHTGLKVAHQKSGTKSVKKSLMKLQHKKHPPLNKGVMKSVALDQVGFTVGGDAAIVLPQGHRGPAFMVFDNFDVIMDWNRSVNYALSVAQFARQLQQEVRIVGGEYAETSALSFNEMLDLQQILNALGFDAGEPDGLPGIKTQHALRQYQLANGLPADGYASRTLYQRLYSEQYGELLPR